MKNTTLKTSKDNEEEMLAKKGRKGSERAYYCGNFINDITVPLAHAYVPRQTYSKAYSPQEALMKGTLFPELYGVYPIPGKER